MVPQSRPQFLQLYGEYRASPYATQYVVGSGQGLFKVVVLVSVILSEAKSPTLGAETLRFAQGDKR